MWFGISNTCGLKPNRLNMIRKTMKLRTGILLRKDFSLLEQNWISTVGGGPRKEKGAAGRAYGRGVIVLLSE